MISDNSTFDPNTLEFYDENAESYSSARPDDVSPELMEFLPNLPTGCHILELGCGGGRDAVQMQRLGFAVDALMAQQRWQHLPASALAGPLAFFVSMNWMP